MFRRQSDKPVNRYTDVVTASTVFILYVYMYMGIVQKVLDLSVVFDDLWYAKMTFGES